MLDNMLDAYLEAVDNGDEATAIQLLNDMDAAATRKYEETAAELDELAEATLGLFEAANELAAIA